MLWGWPLPDKYPAGKGFCASFDTFSLIESLQCEPSEEKAFTTYIKLFPLYKKEKETLCQSMILCEKKVRKTCLSIVEYLVVPH